MNLTYTPQIEEPIINCHEITIHYSHGDADADTYSTIRVLDLMDSDLKKFIISFRNIAEAINDHLHYSKNLPTEVVDAKEDDWTIEIEGITVPIHADMFDAEIDPDPRPASMEIRSIVWYDRAGRKYNVTWN